jgi:hypothetical protein
MDQIGDGRHPVKAAWLLSRLQLLYAVRRSHRCVPFGFLITLGVLAFFLSVVSPYDDDVQKEFVQGQKSKQCVVANFKAACEGHTFCTNKVGSALLPQRVLILCCGVIPHALVPDEEILRTIYSSGTGDRSPPSRSS